MSNAQILSSACSRWLLKQSGLDHNPEEAACITQVP